MKLKIGLDLDGTICDTPNSMLRELKILNKISPCITVDDLKNHNFEYFPEDNTGFPGITKHDIDNIFAKEEFWVNIEIYPEVVPIIQKLHEQYEIHIVTAREPHVNNITTAYLFKHSIPFDYIHYCRSKYKWKYVKENQIDYFVEDYEMPANLIALFCKKVFVVNRPWNKIAEIKGCLRTTWSEIEQMLLKSECLV